MRPTIAPKAYFPVHARPAPRTPTSEPQKASGYGGGSWQKDQYQGGTRNPQEEYQRQQRYVWLKAELDRIAACRQTCQGNIGEWQNQIRYLRNEVGQLKGEDWQAASRLSTLQDQLNTAETRKIQVKRELKDEYYKSNWQWLHDERYQLNDRISSILNEMSDLKWKKSDLAYKINSKQQEVSSLETQIYNKQTELYQYKYEYDTYAAEIRTLGGSY